MGGISPFSFLFCGRVQPMLDLDFEICLLEEMTVFICIDPDNGGFSIYIIRQGMTPRAINDGSTKY